MPGHGTITQADEMANGVECDGGIRGEEVAGFGGVSVAVDLTGATVSAEETMAAMAREEAERGVAVSTTETNGESMACGGEGLSASRA